MNKTIMLTSNSPPLRWSLYVSLYSLFDRTSIPHCNPFFVPESIRHGLSGGRLVFIVLYFYRHVFKKNSFAQNLIWITAISSLAIACEVLTGHFFADYRLI